MMRPVWKARLEKQPTHKSLVETLLQSSAPSIIAGLLAVAGGFFLASKSEVATKSKTYLDSKLRHADESTEAFADYVSGWRRLSILCESLVGAQQTFDANWANSQSPEATEQRTILDQKRAAVLESARSRPPRRDRLMQRLEVLKLYFSKELVADIDSFVAWDADQQAKQCKELPPTASFEQYQARIISRLREEVMP